MKDSLISLLFYKCMCRVKFKAQQFSEGMLWQVAWCFPYGEPVLHNGNSAELGPVFKSQPNVKHTRKSWTSYYFLIGLL